VQRESLLKEKMKRDRKIELDYQYELDAASIDKKKIDPGKGQAEKDRRLSLSQQEYDRKIEDIQRRDLYGEYQPRADAESYLATIQDTIFSKDRWFSVFIETEDGALTPLQTGIADEKVERSYKVYDGSLQVRFATTLTVSEIAQRSRMNAPVGKKIVVFYATPVDPK
jgi:hypothetical protein